MAYESAEWDEAPVYFDRPERERYEQLIRDQNEAAAAHDFARVRHCQQKMEYLRQMAAARAPKPDAQKFTDGYSRSRIGTSLYQRVEVPVYIERPAPPAPPSQGMTRGYLWAHQVGKFPGYQKATMAPAAPS